MSVPVILEPRPVITSLDLFGAMKWIDGTPLLGHIEPYRRRIFQSVLDEKDAAGRPRYNLALTGRAKKNWKSADLVLAALYALLAGAPGGAQVYLLANDEEQAGDDLSLAKKIVEANPVLGDRLDVRQKLIERLDGRGLLEILPARDVVGTHGKTYRFAGFDEIHGYRDWDLLEAMQLDPTRTEAQMWITTYASIHHRPGVPLFDLLQRAPGKIRDSFSVGMPATSLRTALSPTRIPRRGPTHPERAGARATTWSSSSAACPRISTVACI